MSNLYHDPGPPSLSGRTKIMLATTAYDSPDASYTYSISRSREALHDVGIPTAYLLLSGNCHVDDARNTVVRDFLASDCDELVFLDADVSWEPEQLVRLCGHDCDVVGGVYPYRRDGGGSEMPVRMLAGQFVPDENDLIEQEGLPTGFLRIRRHVLEHLAVQSENFAKDNQQSIPVIFERDILNGGRRSGDIRFGMRWREMGGQLFADAELTLGHCGKQVIRDSLAACLRRQMGTTLKHVCDLIRAGDETASSYSEILKAIGNPWGAQKDVLSLAVLLARKANGPILEAGSGLSTILMAAANPDQQVWAIEHHPLYALQLEIMARQAGVGNIFLVTANLKDGWYDLTEDAESLPSKFAVALVDGPPRLLGDRMKFFDVFGDRVSAILIDDADDREYADKLRKWTADHGRAITFGEARSAVITNDRAIERNSNVRRGNGKSEAHSELGI